MVLKRSVFEIQKQRTKNYNDPSYGYGAIHENVTKMRNCAKRHRRHLRGAAARAAAEVTDVAASVKEVGVQPSASGDK